MNVLVGAHFRSDSAKNGVVSRLNGGWNVRSRLAAKYLELGILLLILSIASACHREQLLEPFQIRFEARWNDTAFSCHEPILLDGGRTLTPTQLKFFAYRFRLVDDAGSEVPVMLQPDDLWQLADLVLLDFEDGAGNCRNGSAATHTVVIGMVTPGSYRLLRFTLGVPFALNHQDPARALPPLTGTTMHWNWQGGYKFFRFDGRLDDKSMEVHLGSTGCEGTIGHISSCQRPNRAEVEVQLPVEPASTAPEARVVVLRLDRLLRGLSELPSDPVSRKCMGGAEEPACVPIFSALGLDGASGRSVSSAEVFELR